MKKRPFLQNVTKRQMAEAMYHMANLRSRLSLGSGAGMQFEGARDLYKTFGYAKDPDFEVYKNLYSRNGIARRVVEAVSDETWRKDPVIVDGEVKSNGTELTPFLVEYNKIVERLGVYQHFRNADINCGMGRWSLIYMGIAGEQDLKSPISKPKGRDVPQPGRLLYMATYDEGQVPKFAEVNKEMTSSRFGMPILYEVHPSGKEEIAGKKLVHYSRVLHIAENTRRSPIIGVPRLQAVLNFLYDLEKVAGSASEAFWLGVYRGFLFGVKDDYAPPVPGDADYADLEAQIESFVHGMNRYIFAEGLDRMESVSADIVSPNEHFKMLVSLIAGTTSIPQRILIGSERGELASDQDDKNFADFIDVRRTKFAEVQFIRPFVQFLLEHAIIPQPASGEFHVEHQSLFELNEVEKADVAYKVAQAIYVLIRNNPAAANSIPVDQFFKKYLGFAIDIRTGKAVDRDDNPIEEEPEDVE